MKHTIQINVLKIVLVSLVSILAFSCSGAVNTPSENISGEKNAATGTISISVPWISPLLATALTHDPLSSSGRAYTIADSVKVELYQNGMDEKNKIDTWSYTPDPAAFGISESGTTSSGLGIHHVVPGSNYFLKVMVFNHTLSSTVAEVAGWSQSFTVNEREIAYITVPCIPVVTPLALVYSNISTAQTALETWVPVEGDLPSKIGSDLWYTFTPTDDQFSVDLIPEADSTVALVCWAYDGTGRALSVISRPEIGAPGKTVFFTQNPNQQHYLLIIDIGSGTAEQRKFTIDFAEDNTANEALFYALRQKAQNKRETACKYLYENTPEPVTDANFASVQTLLNDSLALHLQLATDYSNFTDLKNELIYNKVDIAWGYSHLNNLLLWKGWNGISSENLITAQNYKNQIKAIMAESTSFKEFDNRGPWAIIQRVYGEISSRYQDYFLENELGGSLGEKETILEAIAAYERVLECTIGNEWLIPESHQALTENYVDLLGVRNLGTPDLIETIWPKALINYNALLAMPQIKKDFIRHATVFVARGYQVFGPDMIGKVSGIGSAQDWRDAASMHAHLIVDYPELYDETSWGYEECKKTLQWLIDNPI